MTIPDLDALRALLPTLSVEARAAMQELIDAWQPMVDQVTAPKDRWFHVSPHLLAPGTVLTPASARGGPATSQDFYDAGTHVIGDAVMGTTDSRTDVVWVTHDLADARFWAVTLGAPHCYEVTPSEEPRPWNGTGSDGWVAASATVVAPVPLEN